MIEFFGTPLIEMADPTSEENNIATMCRVSEARTAQIIDALVVAKEQAYLQFAGGDESSDVPFGVPPHEAFSLVQLINGLHVDADTPAELLLLGFLIGRTYADEEQESIKAVKRLDKLANLMAKDPVKAMAKIKKDYKRNASK